MNNSGWVYSWEEEYFDNSYYYDSPWEDWIDEEKHNKRIGEISTVEDFIKECLTMLSSNDKKQNLKYTDCSKIEELIYDIWDQIIDFSEIEIKEYIEKQSISQKIKILKILKSISLEKYEVWSAGFDDDQYNQLESFIDKFNCVLLNEENYLINILAENNL